MQIFGYEINRMRDAALMVQDLGVDIVDINCGCPAPKVVKRGRLRADATTGAPRADRAGD